MQNYKYLLYLYIILSFGCSKKEQIVTNDLIFETSPYLLQHAKNPVNWKAWNQKSLNKAKEENKLMVISIGYASCHWCHVMEKESFSDSIVASTMNSNFINIKVDREERPDVDKVYMKALQLMTGNGGWPLNVIALPDGRPVYTGTYFSKNQWLGILEQISEKFKNSPDQFYELASKLEKGIQDIDLIELNTDEIAFEKSFLEKELKNWQLSFDTINGGSKNTPKFMMPNNYKFLLRYAHQNDDKKLMHHVENTLNKISFGGVFDHINGGFSRYAVDNQWHIPHFEKMLYDNAQLVSLYSNAYQLTKNETYKKVVYETLDFIKNEMTSPEGMFYSSIDADSYNNKGILEEGAYYSWTENELKKILKKEFNLFSNYFNINEFGKWEDEKYVLIKSNSDSEFCKKNNLSISDFELLKNNWRKKLKEAQIKRNKPKLDDKSLTSWNALMITAYIDSYAVFNEQKYLDIANKAARFILENQFQKNGKLFHNYTSGKTSVNGYLEDYATTIEAFIKLYQVTGNEVLLDKVKFLVDYTLNNFYDTKSKMFYFTSRKDAPLLANTIEVQDNVIASSNSIMAKNLFVLSHYFSSAEYLEISTSMLNNIKLKINNNGYFFSNWLDLMLNFTNPFYEVVISGENAKEKLKELNNHYLPNILSCYSNRNSELPLLKNRFISDETYIYVCINNSCKLPVEKVSETLSLLEK